MAVAEKREVALQAAAALRCTIRAPQQGARQEKLVGMSKLTHLQRLEAESIHIMREVAAEAENPVMMYTIGKDSSLMLRLAMKAFAPGKPPFPMLHVNTGWKFKNMIQFRDQQMKELGLNLISYTNLEAQAQGINPFDHGSAYTDIMKTQALKQ